MTESRLSALVAEVPEAEPIVAEHRARLDSGAILGVPAHVTVLFPFMPAARIDEQVTRRLADLFASFQPVDITFSRPNWFGDAVLWLDPGDGAPLRALTDAVVEAFPDFLPYGGQFDEVIPHLTVGVHGTPDDLRTAEEAITARLPIHATVATVSLFTGTSQPESWIRYTTFRLG